MPPLREQFVPGTTTPVRPRGNTTASHLVDRAAAVAAAPAASVGLQPNDPRQGFINNFVSALHQPVADALSNPQLGDGASFAAVGLRNRRALEALGQAEQSAPVNLSGGGRGGGGGSGLSSALSQIAQQYGGLRDEVTGNRDFALGEISAALADHQAQIDKIAEDYMAQSGEVNENIARRYAEAVDRTTADANPLIADLRAQGIDPSQFATTLVEANQATRTQGALQSALGERLAQIQSDGLNDSRRTASLIDQGATVEVERQFQAQIDRIAEAQLAAEINARAQAAAASRRASAALAEQQAVDPTFSVLAPYFASQGLPSDPVLLAALDEVNLLDNHLGFADEVDPGFNSSIVDFYAGQPERLDEAIDDGNISPEVAEAALRRSARELARSTKQSGKPSVLERRTTR